MTELFPDAFSDMVRVRKHGVAGALHPGSGDSLNRSRLQKGIFQADLTRFREPVTVSVTTGIGSKIKLAAVTGIYDTVGTDVVAMCVNSVAAAGAEPMYFMHHLTLSAEHDNSAKAVVDVLSGITSGCEKAGIPSIGMNVYEASDQVARNGVLLSGYSTGIAENSTLTEAAPITDGDMLIGLSSSGVHCSGFQFITERLDMSYENLSRYIPEFSKTLGEELLTPSRIYSRSIVQLMACGRFHVRAIAHVVTGGLEQSIGDILPEGVRARVFASNFPIPEIFHLISRDAGASDQEMFSKFNMGIGLVIAIPKDEVGGAINALIQCGEHPYAVGCCFAGDKGVDFKW